MRTYRRVMWKMLALALLLSTTAAGAEYIIDKNAVNPVHPTYPSLEALRLAPGVLQAGDTIILNSNDDSLTMPLVWNDLTIRSAGNSRHTISPASGWGGSPDVINIWGANPLSLTLDRVAMDGSNAISNPLISVDHTGAPLSGAVSITNSLLTHVDLTGVSLTNIADTTFRNTEILGTETNVQFNNTVAGETAELGIAFDRNAGLFSRWDGTLSVSGGTNVGFNIASDRYFTLGDMTGQTPSVAIGGTADILMTKTGGGTLRLGSGVDDNRHGRLDIQEGRVQFSEHANWTGDNIHVGKNGVFKPTIDFYDWDAWRADQTITPNPGDRSRFYLNTFTSEEGARLEIGNVSTLPVFKFIDGGSVHYMFYVSDVEGTNIASTMRIDNKLLTAHFERLSGDVLGDEVLYPDGYYLRFEKVNDLATLEGVGSYADAYRHSDLSDLERDKLDTIYATGGTAADKGFLQTVGGVIIQNSLLVQREHNANIVRRINRRLTAYQDEELDNVPAYIDDIAVSSESLGDCYDDCGDDGENFYNETWAFLDHGRSAQDDIGSDAGYRMNTTTLGIGHDWHADQWIYGGMLSYATGSMKLENQSATKNDFDMLTAAIYAGWAQDGWYLSGVGTATYGWNSAHSAYMLPGLTLGSDADFATSALGIAFEAGHMLETEFYGVPLRVTPYGSLAHTRMSRDSVSDTGARDAALGIDLRKSFRTTDWNTWEAAIGFRLAVPMQVNEITVVPSVDLSYARSSGKKSRAGGEVRLYSNPSGAWDVGIADAGRGALRMAAGVEAEIREDISLGATYEFEWRKQYWNNRFNINVSMDF